MVEVPVWMTGTSAVMVTSEEVLPTAMSKSSCDGAAAFHGDGFPEQLLEAGLFQGHPVGPGLERRERIDAVLIRGGRLATLVARLDAVIATPPITALDWSKTVPVICPGRWTGPTHGKT